MTRAGLIILLVTMFCPAAHAGDVQDLSAPIPRTVVMEEQANRFQNFVRKIHCRAGSFRTTITVQELRRPARFAGGAAVQVYSDDIVRSIYLDAEDPNTLLETNVTEHIDDRSGRMTRHYVNMAFKIGESVPVEVVWTSKEVAFFLHDRKLWTFQIPKPTHLVLMVVGAAAKFDKNEVACGLIS